jgi:hypothetical protein
MKPFLYLFLVVVSPNCKAQTANNTNLHNKKNIYYQTLAKYIAEYKKEDPSSRIDTILVSQDNNTTDSLLDNIGSMKVVRVPDPYQYITLHNGEPIVLYRIFPLEYAKGEFSVSIVPFPAHIDTKQKILHLENPGTFKYTFKFQNGTFVFVRYDEFGI